MATALQPALSGIGFFNMNIATTALSFWSRWLYAVTIGVVVFGLVLVVSPSLAREGFSMLVYADAQRVAGFGTEAVHYIALVHAVLGAVMVGWGVALLLVVRHMFAHGVRAGWQVITVSAVAWFIPDTVFSLQFGCWQNAVLNAVFLLLFAIPLAATYGTFRVERRVPRSSAPRC